MNNLRQTHRNPFPVPDRIKSQITPAITPEESQAGLAEIQNNEVFVSPGVIKLYEDNLPVIEIEQLDSVDEPNKVVFKVRALFDRVFKK